MHRRLNSFDINVIVSDLQVIIGCQIDKIFQISRNEILIKIKNIESKIKETIYIRNGEIITVTKKDFTTPTKPSTFAMTLRKYLQNGRILEISQHESDRIIKIKIGKKDGAYTLVIEFFSEGNIILINPEGNIILPFIRQTWAHRKVKGKEKYIPPPSQINPFNIDFEEFKDHIKESDSDIVRTLAVNINLSGSIAEEICIKSDVDKSRKIKDIKDSEIKKIYNIFIDFIKKFKEGNLEPVIVKKDKKIIDILPFKFQSYKNVDFEKVNNMIYGLERFIEIKKIETKKEIKKDDRLGKLQRQAKQQIETIQKLKKHIEIKKFEGDLIYLNYQQIDKILREITQVLELKEKEGKIKQINEQKIVKTFNPVDNLLILNLKDTSNNIYEVKINFRKTVSENAEKAYADNKKFRSKLNGAEKSLRKTNEEIKKIEQKKVAEEIKEEKINEKKEQLYWFERYRWFISSNGNIVIGGKDSKTNEIVVKKYLKEGDRYAHADIQGAPSIVIKSKNIDNEKISITIETLDEACIFAASFSKAWKQFAEAQSYWVLPEQVSKTAQSGEFVPKGAFIIRGKRNYKRCKLEVAVGEIKIDEKYKIMCGPINAIKKMSKKYAVLVPGDIKKSDLANRLAKTFKVSVEIVDRVLPPGGASIIETFGFE